MARLARIVIPNLPHHIIQRGNRCQRVFFSNEDRQYYLRTLSENAKANNLSIWAYCLMDNHVHLIVVPENEGDLAKVIGDTHRNYTRRINFREGWRGYLWQGRFTSSPLDESHLYSAVRYIEQNPVRAGIVSAAESYPWSSARAHVLKIKNEILSGDELVVMEINDWAAYLANPEDDHD